MTDFALLGPWVRRFLLEHLVSERNLAYNTQCSYRDTLILLISFTERQGDKKVDQLKVVGITAELVRLFLRELEEQRGCCVATRNQRLAAIHALARFIAVHSPEHLEWCGQICAIPFKKAPTASITYLEKPEMEALLAAPDCSSAQGRRDHALLLFLYNTGARADEAAQLTIADLELARAPKRDRSVVRIHGKGNKLRRCPLWPQTVSELLPLIGDRAPSERVFLNRRGEPLTRFGIHTMVERHAKKVVQQMPSVATKRVSPHTIRHYADSQTMPSESWINCRNATL
jgi:site-specific recombinase XerD